MRVNRIKGGVKMSKIDAVKEIYKYEEVTGLPEAVEIYNYLSAYYNVEVTKDMIVKYFGTSEYDNYD